MSLQPVAFFDRDGTLIEDQAYFFDSERIAWQPGALRALRRLNTLGWKVVVVTNQSAVARGFCTEGDVQAFHLAMVASAYGEGVEINEFDYCPFLADATVARYRVADHPDRKPNPGMILRHRPSDPVACARSFLIGDNESDIAAANAAGIAGYLYQPGKSLFDLVEEAIATSQTGQKNG